MKIRRNDPELLIIQDYPFVLCGLLLIGTITSVLLVVTGLSETGIDLDRTIGGLLGLTVCSVGLIGICRWTVFRFDAVSGKLSWSRRRLFSRPQEELPLAEIESASVGSLWDSDGLMHRVVLVLKSGSLPIAASYSGIDDCDQIAESIREWLTNYAKEAEPYGK